MDSLTHTVLGACMGEAIAGKQMGKKAMLIGALAHNFPDIDVIFNFFTTQASSLLTHRGITHSILCNVIFSFLFAAVFKKYIKNDSMSYKRWLILISSGLFTHILIDAFTTYGTGWFEPFNNFRVSFNAMFILDPFFMIALLIPASVLVIAKKTSEKRTKWANAALIISGLYLCICVFNKLYAKSKIEKDLEAQNIIHDEYMFTPTPLNNLLYYIVARKDENCYVGYYSVFDKAPAIKYELFKRNDSLLDPIRNDDEIKKLIRFSKGYYNIHREDSALMFSDIRFGQLGGWYKENSPFVFNFNVAKTVDNRVALQQGRFKSFDPDVMSKLIERIKGNKN
ncbi:MAG: metal-dependent hydrolase [Bacteroidetes bacterium]|jgi:inner membrane protein|nr:metal-dependent hydrolase [Bacteroidota bacterium]